MASSLAPLSTPVSLYYITKLDFEDDLMFYDRDSNSWWYTLSMVEPYDTLPQALGGVELHFDDREGIRVKELRGVWFDV